MIVLEAMTDLSAADLLLLSVVNTTNVLTFFIFLSRVKWPNTVTKLGIATILMAIPAIVIASLNKTAGREWLYWVMPLVLVAWAVLAFIVDIVRKEEFRQPRNTKILVPFLLLADGFQPLGAHSSHLHAAIRWDGICFSSRKGITQYPTFVGSNPAPATNENAKARHNLPSLY